MAIIGKIQQQSNLLIGAVGVAMLLFIVGGDFLGKGNLFSNGPETDVAMIYGTAISQQEFETRVQDEIAKGYGGKPVDEQTQTQIRNRVWNMFMQERIMFKEFDELGISITSDELFNEISGDNPNAIVRQYFSDPQTGQIISQFVDPMTGGLSSAAVLGYVKQVLNSETPQNWLPVEDAIKSDRMNTKYNTLIKKGLYATKKESELAYVNQTKKVSFSYVLADYASIPDSSVVISDGDLSSYYAKHSKEPQYKQEENMRSIKYLVFDVNATDFDIEFIKNEIAQLKADFSASTNDTLFVAENAEDQSNIRYVSKGDMNAELAMSIDTMSVGTVFGPYRDGQSFKLTKYNGTKLGSDSVKASHILLRIEGDTASVMAMADSLKAVAKKSKNFAELAQQYSTDPGSATNGGDLDWFTEGRMVPEFNDACFAGSVGDYVIVTTQFGVHLINITDKTKPTTKYLLATVDHSIKASQSTFDDVFNKASEFSINNNTEDKFNSEGNAMGIRVADNLKENDKTIVGISTARAIVLWAYKAEVGQVSAPFETEDKYVVALLTSIKPKGIQPLDNVRDMVRNEVLNEKKFEVLKAKMEGKGSLADVAASTNSKIENVNDLTFAQFSIPGIGGEKELIGTVYSLTEGQMSVPVQGKRGSYVVQIVKIAEAPAKDDLTNEKATIANGFASRVDYEVFNALKKYANVEDNRARFY